MMSVFTASIAGFVNDESKHDIVLAMAQYKKC